MSVGRDHAPGDGVRPGRESPVHGDRDRAVARPDDLPRVHARAAAVVDADRAERGLDRLAELQRDLARALTDDRVVARRGLLQGRVAERRRRSGQRGQDDCYRNACSLVQKTPSLDEITVGEGVAVRALRTRARARPGAEQPRCGRGRGRRHGTWGAARRPAHVPTARAAESSAQARSSAARAKGS